MGVIIGMDPHKRSATIEVIDERARVLAAGRYGTDTAGYAEMLAAARKFADRIWAVEGCNGIGRHLAHRLVHDGEIVFDVPPKLSAQVRVFAAGNGRKTDPVDAHSVALVAQRAPGLVQVQVEEDLVVMGMLADRRDELGRARTQVISRLHRLLLELLPGGARKFLSARQARTMIASVRQRDPAGKTRRRLAAELIGELEATEAAHDGIKVCYPQRDDLGRLVVPPAHAQRCRDPADLADRDGDAAAGTRSVVRREAQHVELQAGKPRSQVHVDPGPCRLVQGHIQPVSFLVADRCPGHVVIILIGRPPRHVILREVSPCPLPAGRPRTRSGVPYARRDRGAPGSSPR